MLAAVHDLHLLELVAETLRAALDDLAAVVPDWLRGIAQPIWFERYGRRVEDYRLPKARAEREALALAIGADGFTLLAALEGPDAPPEAHGVRAFGLRRSRYIGRTKTGLQQVCVAAAINVSRAVNWLAGMPRAKTRVTRFAALAKVA